MKTYIFISMSICNIGGAQQYKYNKINFLKKSGYRVYLFSAMKGQVVIDDFQQYVNYILPAIMYAPTCYTKKEVNRTLKKIIEHVKSDDTDEYYIESDGIDEAKWAEMLAKRINGKHILINLQETHDYSESEVEFLRYKFNRQEIAGITKESVKMMLKDETIPFESWQKVSAFCNNVVGDIEDKFSSLLKEASITFGYIGRLEKTCVLPIIKNIINYCSGFPDEEFNLILIGGSNSKRVTTKINDTVAATSNINLIITGYVYPIPKKIFNNVDLFISTAGSAYVSYLEHRPTIRVHPITGEPVGIFGESFLGVKRSMYDVIPDTTIEQLIERIIQGKADIQYGDIEYASEYNEKMRIEFARQVSFFDSKTCKEYYDISRIKKRGVKQIAYKIIGKCCGGYRMQKILDFSRKVVK